MKTHFFFRQKLPPFLRQFVDEPAGSLAGLPFKVVIMLPLEIQNRLEEIRSQIEDLGAELIDISVRHAGSRSVLTVLVDKPGGVTLENCVEINRKLSFYFDELSKRTAEFEGSDLGVISGPYYLEVNSPGLDRPLKTEKDFLRAVGETVKIVSKDPAGVVMTTLGEVLSVNQGMVELKSSRDGSLMFVPLEAIIKAAREIKI